MATINVRRLWLGTVVAWVVWVIWSLVINIGILGEARHAAQHAGYLLLHPRYSFFYAQWMVVLLLLSAIIARFYVWVRGPLGPGPLTAFKVGLMVGFAAGFPSNFATATWFPISRFFPLWWLLELWVGAVLAAMVAGYLYKD